MDRIKCVVVGDTDTGKTSLIRTFTTVTNPGGIKEDFHTEFAVFKTQIKIRGEFRELDIYDIPTNSDHCNLVPSLFSNANLFLICFSVLNRVSFENIWLKWLPMVQQHNSKVPIFLIGTKIDMRISRGSDDCVMRFQGAKVVKGLNLNGYFECTSLEHKVIKRMFKNIVRIVLKQ